MANQGCRDCSRCTEGCLTRLIMIPFRLVGGILFGWTRLNQRNCPVCGHALSLHARDASGRFKD